MTHSPGAVFQNKKAPANRGLSCHSDRRHPMIEFSVLEGRITAATFSGSGW
jgi:hypothetical protein